MRAYHVVYATAAGIAREHYLLAESREQAAGIMRAAKPGIEVRHAVAVRAIEMEVERWVDGADYYPRVCVWRGAGDDLLTGVLADVPEKVAYGEENGHALFEETGGMMFSQGEEIALEKGEEKRAERLLDDLEALPLSAAAGATETPGEGRAGL